jgi:hypothetical protein
MAHDASKEADPDVCDRDHIDCYPREDADASGQRPDHKDIHWPSVTVSNGCRKHTVGDFKLH